MGNCKVKYLRRVGENFVLNKPFQVVMIGLDNSGKTSILYQYKLKEFITTAPTTAFNVETIKMRRTRLSIWDAGGTESIRPLWQTYSRQADGIIFVVDSTDRKRLEEVKEELVIALNSCKKEKVPILFYANKQDLHYALTPTELVEQLDLNNIFSKNPWYLQPASAKIGDGLEEGLLVFSGLIKDRKKMLNTKHKKTEEGRFPLPDKPSEFYI